jgi:hypothetical protein
MRIHFLAVATASMVGGLLSLPVQAGSITKTQTQNAASACSLSIPTTDTKVRPKATGFRNEGTTNQFVICGFDIDSTDPGFHAIQLTFASIDGAAHSFNCTAMSRYNGNTTGQYLTKVVDVGAGDTASFSISDEDPDYDEAVYNLYPWGQSITCTLPGGVSITSVTSSHDDEDSAV